MSLSSFEEEEEESFISERLTSKEVHNKSKLIFSLLLLLFIVQGHMN